MTAAGGDGANDGPDRSEHGLALHSDGGGCTVTTTNRFVDPLLPLISLLAGWLIWRRRRDRHRT